jgi:hypothetical protein
MDLALPVKCHHRNANQEECHRHIPRTHVHLYFSLLISNN